MIFSTISDKMLKYQKAKAKLVEYDTPPYEYPKFPLNSNELSYPVVYILSRYAESIIENNPADREEFASLLTATAQYFDAAVGSKDRTMYDIDFLTSGAAAYFLSGDFGSAKVLCAELYKRRNHESNTPQKITGYFLGYLLLNHEFILAKDDFSDEKVCNYLLKYFSSGKGKVTIEKQLSLYRYEIYESNSPMEIYYVDILCAIVKTALSKSSWNLLPKYSELDQSLWSDYLKSSNAPKMLWPAQQLIGEKGILRGQNAIVQLPTGVGKTKSIELIIRSSFASERTSTAIIVAPLRALCNEIASEMSLAFGDESSINQFSDVLEDDFSLDFLDASKSRILICTPEKLSYIIHHQAGFLNEIGLFIFDESHMFDDASRGAIYELLITEIKDHITWKDQIVLLSAVLSNAEQIQEWLFDDLGVLASDSKILATPKTIGFTSATKDIHYYSDDSAQEDFFIPRSIDVVEIKKLRNERNQRFFPELSDAQDIALYYANKLSSNGASAIFVGRTSSVHKVIKRAIELKDREYNLAKILSNSDTAELKRLAKLMSEYYGEEHPYTVACHLGILPHYSNMPNGLRLAIEYAFRSKALNVVICTTTLAQGVNIPIKYLFMTSMRVAKNRMHVRSFQNLIGRTARSGMHTEGSIIVTDPELFDNRNNIRNRGVYKWRDCIKMFDSNAAEPCGSAILTLVQGIAIDYQTTIHGETTVQYIIDHYSEPGWPVQYINHIHKMYPEKNIDSFIEAITTRKRTLETIENYLCFVFSNTEYVDKEGIASDICKNTLAYYLANEHEKELLEKVFNVIALKISKLYPYQVQKFARTMIGIDLSLEIEKWVVDNQLILQYCSNEQLFDMIISFYTSTHSVKKGQSCFQDITKMWITGVAFNGMSEITSLPIMDLEDICSKYISYELSFFIGNIIDVIKNNDEESSNVLRYMLLLQRRVKYGVKTETAVSICEKVFNDRYLADLLAEIIGNSEITTDFIVRIIKRHKEEILEILVDYPTFFSERIKGLCKD